MRITGKEREALRGLATRVAEIAALPVQRERINLWKKHHALGHTRPMILVFPEGSWRELLAESAFACETKEAREIERALRIRIYTHEHFRDDTVVERNWFVPKVQGSTGWGLEPQMVRSEDEHGSFGFDPVIKEPADLKKLRLPEVLLDEKAAAERLAAAQDLFGDILDVKLRGVARVTFNLMNLYIKLRGFNEVLLDMYENPGMLHDAMAFIEQGLHGIVRQWRELNLLELNNDNTYHSSGGNGWTDELPRKGFNPARVEPADMWASAESQEMTLVSPEMHWDFVMQYESRLLAPFALNGYGCCEDLTRKMDRVLSLPNIRRISISPFADVAKCAEQIGRRAIVSWKPQPSMLVGEFDDRKVRDYLSRALDATKGCAVEMILKDTHTCESRPERFDRWTQIARELVEQQA